MIETTETRELIGIVGRRLTELNEAGITQKRIAEMFDTTQPQISAIMSGNVRSTLLTSLVRVAEAFGIAVKFNRIGRHWIATVGDDDA